MTRKLFFLQQANFSKYYTPATNGSGLSNFPFFSVTAFVNIKNVFNTKLSNNIYINAYSYSVSPQLEVCLCISGIFINVRDVYRHVRWRGTEPKSPNDF